MNTSSTAGFRSVTSDAAVLEAEVLGQTSITSVLETCQWRVKDTSVCPSSLCLLSLSVSSGKLLVSQSLTRAFKKAKCQMTNLPLKLQFEQLRPAQPSLSPSVAPPDIQQRQTERETHVFGRRVNNLLCFGRLKLVSIDTCYPSADSTEDLIKCKGADGVEPNKPPYSTNFLSVYTQLLLLPCQTPDFCSPSGDDVLRRRHCSAALDALLR